MLIGIIGAMKEEVAPLLAQMNQITDQTIGNHVFHKGKLLGKDVVLTESGIGKVQAASTATILASIFGVTHLINTGSAGSLLPENESDIGDVIISESLAYFDVDLTNFGYKPGQLPGKEQKFKADPQLIEYANQCAGTKNINGLIVSGDHFVCTEAHREQIYSMFPDAAACEMEGAAIAQVATDFNIPFVVIRSISDGANIHSTVKFDEFLPTAAKNAATIVNQIVNSIQ